MTVATTTRPYSMRNRDVAAEQTRRRILQAIFELLTEKLSVEIVLADIAGRAEVSVQTILRHFGSRDGLFDAVVRFGETQIETERRTPVGDVDQALRVIVDHYETRGDWVIAMLAQEIGDERVRAVTSKGKATHRLWVQDVFETEQPDLVDLLVVATDVYTWKLLRRDRGLDRAETEKRMRRLVGAILASD